MTKQPEACREWKAITRRSLVCIAHLAPPHDTRSPFERDGGCSQRAVYCCPANVLGLCQRISDAGDYDHLMEHPIPIYPSDHAVYSRDKMGKSTIFRSEHVMVG